MRSRSNPAIPPSLAGSRIWRLVLKDLGQLEEARDLLRKAYAASWNDFGPDHPNTKTLKANLQSLPEQ